MPFGIYEEFTQVTRLLTTSADDAAHALIFYDYPSSHTLLTLQQHVCVRRSEFLCSKMKTGHRHYQHHEREPRVLRGDQSAEIPSHSWFSGREPAVTGAVVLV